MRRWMMIGFALLVFCLLTGTQARADTVSAEDLQAIEQQWQESVHALAEVNCSSCHQTQETGQVVARPTVESCRSCHEYAVETFAFGKHGVRLYEGLSPLQPEMAHLPMKEAALDKPMNCNTCHNVHSVNTVQASVDSCLTCHNDRHSLNYKESTLG
ncbi:MAG: cytochrome c3 family protein, partial [Kamptonema sp. SIO4C4]|nr:cytochrome c3 family protein [Kamptonema sp. SIO4C4]